VALAPSVHDGGCTVTFADHVCAQPGIDGELEAAGKVDAREPILWDDIMEDQFGPSRVPPRVDAPLLKVRGPSLDCDFGVDTVDCVDCGRIVCKSDALGSCGLEVDFVTINSAFLRHWMPGGSQPWPISALRPMETCLIMASEMSKE